MAQSSGVHQLFRIKPADQIVAEIAPDPADPALMAEATGDLAPSSAPHLKRTMGLFALTMFSVGSIVGTGIFVILGTAVPKAGPAVLLSFALAGFICLFSALSYAELAGTIPVSGSSYSYAYATLGEIVAWVVGWCLMLEYGVSVAAVAVGWGQYLNAFFADTTGWTIADEWSQPPGDGGVVNITAIVVVVLCMVLLLRGASESATVNTIMVVVKIGILLFFCVIAFTEFDPNNLSPFLPLGFAGVGAAAGQVFFSYIGFDAASTAGEEAKNPRRDLPIAIMLSLLIVTILYVLVTLAAIGAMPWEAFEGAGGEAVLSTIARDVTGSAWAPAIISLGAIISIFSVVLVVMYGQTRILFAMGRDGLLPKVFTKVNPRTQTPVANTIIVTVIIGILAGFVPLGQLAEATSIGTLVAFAIVNIGVIVLWLSRPDLSRSFRTPMFPLLPVLGVVANLYLVASLAAITWVVFFLWMAIGLVIYFAYSRRHSTTPDATQPALDPAVSGPALVERRVAPGGIVSALLVLVLVAVGVAEVFSGETSALRKVLWVLVVVAAVAGLAAIWRGLQQAGAATRALEPSGVAAPSGVGGTATASATAVASLKSGVWLISLGLLVPAVLAVGAVTFG